MKEMSGLGDLSRSVWCLLQVTRRAAAPEIRTCAKLPAAVRSPLER